MAQWRSLIGQSLCNVPSIGQTWVLASIGAVVEMGVLISTIETTAYGVYMYMCQKPRQSKLLFTCIKIINLIEIL
jgi:hypothetical protein